MSSQKKTLKKLAALALAVGSSVVVGASATQANGGWMVSGTVTTADDGAPLAGVEVFLWVDAGDPSGPRYTCTDENGDYSFDGVVTYMMVATGPEVFPGVPCDNSAFLDYRSRPTSALLVQLDGPYFPNGVTLTGPATVNLGVEGLPGSLRQLDRLAVNAMTACWLHGDADPFAHLMANYDKLYDKHSARVDTDDADKYAWFSESIWPIFAEGVVCPPGTA